jgi:hypothetical protein
MCQLGPVVIQSGPSSFGVPDGEVAELPGAVEALVAAEAPEALAAADAPAEADVAAVAEEAAPAEALVVGVAADTGTPGRLKSSSKGVFMMSGEGVNVAAVAEA